jgi:hypothetical protein
VASVRLASSSTRYSTRWWHYRRKISSTEFEIVSSSNCTFIFFLVLYIEFFCRKSILVHYSHVSQRFRKLILSVDAIPIQINNSMQQRWVFLVTSVNNAVESVPCVVLCSSFLLEAEILNLKRSLEKIVNFCVWQYFNIWVWFYANLLITFFPIRIEETFPPCVQMKSQIILYVSRLFRWSKRTYLKMLILLCWKLFQNVFVQARSEAGWPNWAVLLWDVF